MNISFPEQFDIQENVSLTHYTTIRVGGPARYLCELNKLDDFVELVTFCQNNNIRLCTLGGGTNVFFVEEGFDGLVAVIKFNDIKLLPDNRLYAQAGVVFQDLVDFCTDHSLTGCEYAAGIPGTVGGAVFGNAGAYGKNIGETFVKGRLLLPNGEIKTVPQKELEFDYRHSALKENGALFLDGEFRFEPGDKNEIADKVSEILAIRAEKLPGKDVATAGSWFKNLQIGEGRRTAAATYLDAVGSKTTRVNDAAVYHNHANILINTGNATASDLLQLENTLKQKVKDEFGIVLEREVINFNFIKNY